MRSWLLSSGIAALFLFGCCGQKSAGDGATNDRREAPEHNAPDQDRIDSLKEEKQKEKN